MSVRHWGDYFGYEEVCECADLMGETLEHRRREIGPALAQRIAEHRSILDRLDTHLGPVNLDWIAKKLLRRKP